MEPVDTDAAAIAVGPSQATSILRARIQARMADRGPADGTVASQPTRSAPQLGPPPPESAAPSTQSHNLLLSRSQGNKPSASTPAGLSPEEQEVVKQLKARDREVRNHEQAHAAVGGQYAGQPSYTYQAGPDGQNYAVGGEVAIDVAPIEGDPEATIQKMEIVKAAALAPAEPSGQDRKVAALADAQRAQAMADLAALRRDAWAKPEAPQQLALRV